MLAAMSLPDGTLVDVYRLVSDQDGSYVNKVLPHIKDPIVRNYYEDVARRMRDASSQWKAEFLPYILSKFSRFVEDATLRRMIGQTRSGIPFDQIMDEGKVFLVNLAKGRVGEQNALFIGSLILSGVMQAAFKRSALPPSRRRDFFIYVDEVQNFATPTLATMLSEGRKFGVVLTIANQYLHQLNAQILEAVFGNIGSIVAFRLGIQDASALGMEFHPAFSHQELSGLPQFTAAVKLLIDGVAARPFTMRTLPSMIPPDQSSADLIRENSRRRYGTPLAQVEEEIARRFR
ncbi:MAG: type IV secretion system DNA-binding domain-containing protein [Chloroflexi bacterium]|nr:type IV secretion system DNA-binding domain-containing protein [Chloroflexota bacterium]